MERSVRSITSENSQSCTKLKPEEHIIAYIENREILRDFPPLACDGELLEKVMSNYIILKKILANLSWQEQILSKSVCRTWRDAVLSLQREQFGPCDFVCAQVSHTNQIVFVKSHNFSVEPLAVFVFVEDSFRTKYNCKNISPSPCSPSCTHSHCLLDVIYHSVCFPRRSNCLSIQCMDAIIYMPRPQSKTHKVTLTEPVYCITEILAGLYLPKISNVEMHLIKVKMSNTDHTDFHNEINKMSESRYFKAILVFATYKDIDWNEDWISEGISIVDYFKAVQKDMPYALGGCVTYNTLHDPNLPLLIDTINEGREFDNENEVSIAMFSIPKDMVEDTRFEAYSLVIEYFIHTKDRIQRTVYEFAEKVPRFQYSMALKLTGFKRCRYKEDEESAFRAAFPDTPIIGCYGDYYEFGLNHPSGGPQKDRPVYCNSTVFVYFGWGRIMGL